MISAKIKKKFPFNPPVYRSVLKISSINFSFKSIGEQRIIIDGFAKLLNSINCTVQILCDNQVVNPDEWLLKIHDEEYYQFLKKIINEKNVTTKSFYIAFAARDESELRNTKLTIMKQIKRCSLIAEEVDPEEPTISPQLSRGNVKVGDWYYNTFMVEDWPHSGEAGWLEDLYNLDKNISLSMFIHPANKDVSVKFINKRIGQLESNGIIKKTSNNDDGSEDEEINTALNMRNELNRNDGKFFFVNYYVTVKAKSLEELKRESNDVKSFLNGLMINSKKLVFRQDDGFRCSLPHGVDYLQSKCLYTFTTTPLKSFFPFISSNIVDKDGILIGENLLNNSLIFLNHFNYLTSSTIVLGKSGSGKSYCVKSQIKKLKKQGVEVTVLDRDDEFSRLPQDDNLLVKKFKTITEYKAFLVKYWEDVRNNPYVPRFLVIDELWEYLKDEESADIIQQIIKKGRKYWLGLCGITQEIEDILKSEYSRSIINNSSIKILLKMDYHETIQLQKHFGLTQAELSFLVNASEGEGIIFADTNHAQFKTIVTEEEHKMFTTRPQEMWKEKVS